ncbi:hypothetical protein EMCRGX_G026343 [Ephydatia muelleri]|eukprot:Em0014g553a
MKSRWQRARKRSRKALLMMKKAMSRLLCLQREATSVRDTTQRLSNNITDVLANDIQSIPATRAGIGEDIRDTGGSDVRTLESTSQTGVNSKAVPQGADTGNEIRVEDIDKECVNVTTDTTEQRVGDDLESSCAGKCDNAQNDDSAVDSKDSKCENEVACKSCDESRNECAKEAITKVVIEGDCQIKNENEGCSEDSNLLKKASEIASFTKLHSDVVEKLTSLCQLWEQKSPNLSIPEERQEEVLGQIRTTVCQAQLLMRQKLKQYIGLVGQAEHGGGEQPTKVEDLQGFWDMVYFQVEDILKKFQGLEDLEKNNWKAVSELQSFPKKGKKPAALPSAKVPSTAAETSEKQLAAREKREAARLKIKELRAMAVNKKVQNVGNDIGDERTSGDSKSNAVSQSELSNCDIKVPPSADLVIQANGLKNNENRSECGLESAPLQISTAPLTSEN